MSNHHEEKYQSNIVSIFVCMRLNLIYITEQKGDHTAGARVKRAKAFCAAAVGTYICRILCECESVTDKETLGRDVLIMRRAVLTVNHLQRVHTQHIGKTDV